jgi:hypothetical protein
MKILALILVLAVCPCYARETRSFFGRWTPPASLQEFWKPINESWWWNKRIAPNSKLDRYCSEFAKRTTPERIIPDMIADLKSNPSEVRWFVYLDVMLHWSQQRVLRVLKLFCNSRDPDIAHIASEFQADVEPLERRAL